MKYQWHGSKQSCISKSATSKTKNEIYLQSDSCPIPARRMYRVEEANVKFAGRHGVVFNMSVEVGVDIIEMVSFVIIDNLALLCVVEKSIEGISIYVKEHRAKPKQ